MEHLSTGASRLGIELTPAQTADFQTYYELLIEWNNRFNLTAIIDYHDVQVKHFLDSLTVASALPATIPVGFKLIDIGSGAGFPGLPLKIVFPQIEITLLEATGKKAEFLKYVAQALKLERVSIVTSRAEDTAHLPEYREQFNAVVARGLAEMSVLAELTLPFCRIGGLLIAQKKGGIEAELEASVKAIRVLGGNATSVNAIEMPEFTDSRCLVVVDKVSQTPLQFPRRPGMPSKKPLG